MKTFAVLLAVVVCCASVLADTHYVSLLGSHTPPFDSGDAAATNIQDAVDAAVTPGDVVLVTNGTYYLSASILPERDLSIESVGGAGVTIVDGQDSTRCFDLGGGTITGFTITNGYASGSGPDGVGGGVYFHGGGSVRACTISGNFAENGGGVYCEGGGIVTNCNISGNIAQSGGGVYCEGGGAVLDCEVWENTAETQGGGVFFEGGGLVSGGTIELNAVGSGGSGGGVYCHSGVVVTNCTLVISGWGRALRFHSHGLHNSLQWRHQQCGVRRFRRWRDVWRHGYPMCAS